MENQTNQNPTQELVSVPDTVPVSPTSKNNNLSIIVFAILTLLLLGSTAFLYYQNQQLKNMLASYQTQPSVSPTPIATSELVVSPELTFEQDKTLDPTANWKTYTNTDFVFKYPSEWKEGQGRTTIVSDVAGAGITIFSKDMPMYNECMKLDKTDTVNGKMVKYYSYAYSGEMCTNQANIGNYEVWITKAGGDGFQPGIIYEYNTTIFPKSFSIFQQILSTFSFTK